MPHFFFHLRTPDGLERDEDGLTMPDMETAYLEAYDTIPGMVADFVRRGLSPLPYAFVITNAAGETLMEVPFTERLRTGERRARPGQRARARLLVQEIRAVIHVARETAQRSREILARSGGCVTRSQVPYSGG